MTVTATGYLTETERVVAAATVIIIGVHRSDLFSNQCAGWAEPAADCSYHLITRMARSVFHRLGRPSPSLIAKCSLPGCEFSKSQRPSAPRLERTSWTASATRSSGAAPAARW
jgi:hypothetical protein